MRWLRTIWDEVFGLFVDDGSFALSILGWLAVVGALAWGMAAMRPWLGPLLFAGLAAILAVGVARGSRRR